MTRNLLWLLPAAVLLTGVAANHDLMGDGWHPGDRHVDDVEPWLQEAFDEVCLTCWIYDARLDPMHQARAYEP